MITTISDPRIKMLSAVAAAQQPQPLVNQQVQQQETLTPRRLSQITGKQAVSPVPDNGISVDFSVSHDVFRAVDDFFNLGKSGRFDGINALSPDDIKQFVNIVAELAKSGYVGFEELIVNKKVERHEVASQIGDQRLRRARVYDDPKDHRSY